MDAHECPRLTQARGDMVMSRVQKRVLPGKVFATKQLEDDVVRTLFAGVAAVIGQTATHPVSCPAAICPRSCWFVFSAHQGPCETSATL